MDVPGTDTSVSTGEELDALIAQTPFEQVTVILHVNRKRLVRLARWARKWADHPHLSRTRLLILHKDLDPARVRLAAAPLTAAGLEPQFLDYAPGKVEPIVSGTVRGFTRAFSRVGTPWFIISPLPRRWGRYAETLTRRIARGHSRVLAIGLDRHQAGDRPVLLNNRSERSGQRAWVWHTLTSVTQLTPTWRDYLGYLALSVGTAKLEGVDPKVDHTTGQQRLDLFARVNSGTFTTEVAPPWSYQFSLISTDGTVHAFTPGRLTQRLDNRGGRRWENLLGSMSLDSVPEGNHRLVVSLVTDHPELSDHRSLQPRPGAVAPARTVLLRGHGVQVRYLIHTLRGSSTWITVQRDSVGEDARTADAETRWAKAMRRKDLRQLATRGRSRQMRAAVAARMLTLPRFAKRSIWLIGERADTAQDNGFHFFRHLREHHPEREAYYIIDKGSPQYPRVAHLGNVVQHSSAKHRLLMLHAEVLANAYSIKHMIPTQWSVREYTRHLAWRVGAYRVYLKHGVHVSPTAVKRGTGGYDLYLSVSERERTALAESSGYREHLVETGMPRYDTLVPGPRTRTILFMPTWRRYLVPTLFGADQDEVAKVDFVGSTYQRFVSGFLSSPRLHELLTRYDYTLQMLPHYNLRQELSAFPLTSDRTSLADTDTTSFQDLIRGCDVFITDYSSVHFDVAYLGTPIIYTHFDREEYEDGHAVTSWFDHGHDGFGPVVETIDDLLTELESLLATDAVPDDRYRQRVDDAFTYRDQNNSARVVAEIDARLAAAREGHGVPDPAPWPAVEHMGDGPD